MDLKIKSKEILKNTFGFNDYKEGQEKAINAILEGRDGLVIMPTGGGKSVCFQVPALAMDGTCIVVSPLISLMKDQVESLKVLGVEAECLNSSLSLRDQSQIIKKLLNGELKILYLAPERLLTEELLSILNSININFFAIDEAHCISSWGHNFRQEYLGLSKIKEEFAQPVIALTATADTQVRDDIVVRLGLKNPEKIVLSFDRPNLTINILPAKNRPQKIEEFLAVHSDESGIIYCTSRDSTEKIAEKLQKLGYKALPYHAGLSSPERHRVQDAFIMEDVQVIVATVAFGMGIDKSNIRWVIHYNLPKNIESYYQEIGRAGRDGLKSETLLFYTIGDFFNIRAMINKDEFSDPVQKNVQLAKLERINQLASSFVCRRKVILNYFDEAYDQDSCGNCDMCLNPPEKVDATKEAKKILLAVAHINKDFDATIGIGNLISLLKGGNLPEWMTYLKKTKFYGLLAAEDNKILESYILQLINLGYLKTVYEKHNTLRITPVGVDTLKNKSTIKLVKPVEKFAAKEVSSRPMLGERSYDKVLFEKLRKLRLTLAKKEDMPPYIIFHDSTLREMASVKPPTLRSMSYISGVGEVKLKKYGQQFFSVIEDHISSD